MSFLNRFVQTARTAFGLSKVNYPPVCNTTGTYFNNGILSMAVRNCYIPPPKYDLLETVHLRGPIIKNRPNKNPLGFGVPFARGVVLKTLVKKPKKPNSANRKCVLVRLHTGKELVAYVPGEGHNLQEHSVVLVRVGRLRDVPGVKLECVRGAYDLGHVIKKKA